MKESEERCHIHVMKDVATWRPVTLALDQKAEVNLVFELPSLRLKSTSRTE